MKSPRS